LFICSSVGCSRSAEAAFEVLAAAWALKAHRPFIEAWDLEGPAAAEGTRMSVDPASDDFVQNILKKYRLIVFRVVHESPCNYAPTVSNRIA